MNIRNATTTMAPSAVITSQRNSVQRNWGKARDRDEESLEREWESNRERGRERAEAESLNSFGSRSVAQDQVQDAEMDIEMDMDKCEGIRVASTSKGKQALTEPSPIFYSLKYDSTRAMPCDAMPDYVIRASMMSCPAMSYPMLT